MELCSLSITTPDIPGNVETLRPREAERSEEHDPDSARSPPYLLTGGYGTWGDSLSFSNRSKGNVNQAKALPGLHVCITNPSPKLSFPMGGGGTLTDQSDESSEGNSDFSHISFVHKLGGGPELQALVN